MTTPTDLATIPPVSPCSDSEHGTIRSEHSAHTTRLLMPTFATIPRLEALRGTAGPMTGLSTRVPQALKDRYQALSARLHCDQSALIRSALSDWIAQAEAAETAAVDQVTANGTSAPAVIE